jgi:Zn-finger nucleic acid-binding protein
MKCPVDGAQLVMTERSGVEIDYCPECRGVWLDRGELDKIIERAAPPPREGPADRARYEDAWEPKPRKRREGFLGDLFDF